MRHVFLPAFITLSLGILPACSGQLRAVPARVELSGHLSEAQVLIAPQTDREQPDKHAPDLTSIAAYSVADPAIVQVAPGGRLLAKSNGTTTIRAEVNGQSIEVPVTVSGCGERPEIGFDSHIRPLISRLGCNAGACHASQFGKG
ncbi:MAG: hypothetical protein KDA85_10210, partial [Planctomycetaceae bacterium]|nr:hypothetical protein [Planctomycetaceae bacterium]